MFAWDFQFHIIQKQFKLLKQLSPDQIHMDPDGFLFILNLLMLVIQGTSRSARKPKECSNRQRLGSLLNKHWAFKWQHERTQFWRKWISKERASLLFPQQQEIAQTACPGGSAKLTIWLSISTQQEKREIQKPMKNEAQVRKRSFIKH